MGWIARRFPSWWGATRCRPHRNRRDLRGRQRHLGHGIGCRLAHVGFPRQRLVVSGHPVPTPRLPYNTPGTYTVAVEVGFNNQSDACTATAFHDIFVKPAPTSAVALSESTGCESLTVTATESNGEGAEYLWTLPDGTQANGISSGAVLLDDVGAHPFSVMVTGSNGCVAVANAVAEVFGAPTADFLVSDVCEGASTAFHDMSLQAGSQAIESWSWAFGDAEGSIDTHPEHVYASAGTYTATLEVFDGRCGGSATQTVEVFDAPSLTASRRERRLLPLAGQLRRIHRRRSGRELGLWRRKWSVGDRSHARVRRRQRRGRDLRRRGEGPKRRGLRHRGGHGSRGQTQCRGCFCGFTP